MPIQPENDQQIFKDALRNEAAGYAIQLSEQAIAQLGQYYGLVQKWNPRLHLVAPCLPADFATRHVLESLTALRYLNEGETVADIGSGGGLPIIPCLITGPKLRGALIEASPKKAVFLREAVTLCELDAQILNDRFENVSAPDMQIVTCRALERFGKMIPAIVAWATPTARLLLFAGAAMEEELRMLDRDYEVVQMPNSDGRYLFVVRPAN
jgi:16S rRNA (guanine527-N7)-methyltransferase